MSDISQFLPHSGKMMLLDSVLDSGENWLQSQVTIREDSMFCQNGSIPALVGIEYMAQTIAAFAGKNDEAVNKKISIGLLLGSRKYDSNVSKFNVGTILTIYVEQIYNETDGLAVFKCKIEGENTLVEAKINVYHPEDISQVLNK